MGGWILTEGLSERDTELAGGLGSNKARHCGEYLEEEGY
jgi:hypothetical protein